MFPEIAYRGRRYVLQYLKGGDSTHDKRFYCRIDKLVGVTRCT